MHPKLMNRYCKHVRNSPSPISFTKFFFFNFTDFRVRDASSAMNLRVKASCKWAFASCLLFLSSIIYAQTAVPDVTANTPFHQTIDQRTIVVGFKLTPATAPILAGTSTASQWTVSINGSSVGITVTGIALA